MLARARPRADPASALGPKRRFPDASPAPRANKMDFVPNPNNPNPANAPFNAHSMYQLPPGGFGVGVGPPLPYGGDGAGAGGLAGTLGGGAGLGLNLATNGGGTANGALFASASAGAGDFVGGGGAGGPSRALGGLVSMPVALPSAPHERSRCQHPGCDKEFAWPQDLRKHVRRFHAGEPPRFVCPRDGGTTPYPSTATQSQICASFKHRRDLVSAVAGAHVGALPFLKKKENGGRRAIRRGAPATTETLSEVTLRPMPSVRDAVLEAARHGAGAPNTIEAERFGMKRSLAWELCFRRIREREREKAKAALLEAHGADAVKDIALDIDLSPGRVVRAVRLPAFIATFTHGETRGPNGDFSPRARVAVVCGTTGEVRVDEDVVDTAKARALAVVGGVLAPALVAAWALGPDAHALLAAQASLGSAAAFALAGAAARRAPLAARARGGGARAR